MLKISFYTFVCLWLLFGGFLGQASTSYLANNGNNYNLENNTNSTSQIQATTPKPEDVNKNVVKSYGQLKLEHLQQFNNEVDKALPLSSINPIKKSTLPNAKINCIVQNLSTLGASLGKNRSNNPSSKPIHTNSTCNLPDDGYGITELDYSNNNFQGQVSINKNSYDDPFYQSVYGSASTIWQGLIYFDNTQNISFRIQSDNGINARQDTLSFTIDDSPIFYQYINYNIGIGVPLGSYTPAIGWHTFRVTIDERTYGGEEYIPLYEVQASYNGGPWSKFSPVMENHVPVEHTFGREDCPSSSNTINPVTGNFCSTQNDLSFASQSGEDLSLDVIRSYNSLDNSNGAFGPGWHFPFDMRLATDSSNYGSSPVTVYNSNGRQDIFEFSDLIGSYVAPSRANSELVTGTVASNPGYILKSADNVTYSFDGGGELKQIKDRNNNQINLAYSGGLLSTISDNHSRVLTVTNNANNHISSITSSSHLTVTYEYDSTNPDLLKKVTNPDGSFTTYNYDTNCNLLNEITDPNGHTILHNTYITETNQVVSQVITPSNGVGYITHLNYNQAVEVPTELNITYTIPIQFPTTVVTDTRGYESVYGYNMGSLRINNFKDPYLKATSLNLNKNDDPTSVIDAKGAKFSNTFNSFGRVTSNSVTANSQVINTQFSYNSYNDPIAITNPLGKQVAITYTDATKPSNPQSITDPLSQATNMVYDTQGRVTSLTSVGGITTTYEYNNTSPNQSLPSAIVQTLSTLDAPSGTGTPASSSHNYRTDLTYTPQGWVASRTDPYEGSTAGGPVSYQYNYRGQVLTATNQLSQHAYNTYDYNGNLTQSLNFLGQQTDYNYDFLNRLTSKVQHVTTGGNLTTSYTYDQAGNVISMTDPRNVSTSYSYDANNRLTSEKTLLQSGVGVYAQTNYSYDEVGNLKTVTRLNTGGSGDQLTSYDYDAANRLTQITYPDTTQEKFEYDAAGNVTKDSRQIDGSSWSDITYTYDELNRTKVKSVLGAVGPSGSLDTVITYNDPQNLVTTIDPYGIKTETTSDPGGRAIKSTITTADNSQSQTSYNIFNSRNLLVTAINAANSRTDFTYDAIGRINASTGYTGTGTTGPLVTTYTYNDTPTPKVTTVGPAPQNEQEEKSYDEAGHLLQTKVLNGSNPALINTYTYDGQGNLASVTDAKLHTINFDFENTGWLSATTQSVTGSPTPVTTSYTYDQVGNQLTYKDPLGHTTTSIYDSQNRLAKITDPGTGNNWQYSYDGLGRLKTLIDGKNQLTQYTYDAASRLLSLTTDANGGNTTNRITTSYTYNNGSQPLTMVDQTGGTSGPTATTTYTYDGFNRLAGVSNSQGIVKYGYDTANRRSQLSFGLPGTSDTNLKQATYGYDSLDRPTAITATNWLGTSQNVGFAYSGLHLDKMLYANGITATYSYDGAGRLTSINQTNSSSATIFSAAYTLDALGNRTAQSENLNGVNRQVNYSYDEMSRMLSESYPSGNPNSHPVTSTYAYDNAGNRTVMTMTLPANTKSGTGPLVLTTNYIYNAANQLTTRSDTGTATPFNSFTYNYTYDLNGSLTSEATNTTSVEATNYSYDVRNRLSGWQKSAKNSTIASASFSYDGTNNRLSMTYGGQTTSYLQDAASPLPVVLMERKGSADPSLFLYPLGASTTPLFQVSGNISSTINGMWYHSDGLGSVRDLTLSSGSSNGASGAVVDTSSFSAFGLSAGENNTGKVDNSHRFAGEQLDPTGLYYNRARYYNPILGRFIGRDPVSGNATDPSTLNRYVYAANNPGLLVDPSGNFVSNTPQLVDEHDTPISDADAQAQVSLARAGIFLNVNLSNSSSSGANSSFDVNNIESTFSYGGGSHTPASSNKGDCSPEGLQNKDGLGCASAQTVLDPISVIRFVGVTETGQFIWANDSYLGYGDNDDPKKEAAKAAEKAVAKFAAEGGNSSGSSYSNNQVDYGSTPESKAVADYRLKNGLNNGRNVAIATYKDENGNINSVIRMSDGPERHSEKLIDNYLKEKGIKSSDIISLYTEREPCVKRGCSGIVSQYKNAKITYSFEYGNNKASQDRGNKAYRDAINNLFRKQKE